MGNRKDREEFGAYISSLREKKGYALEQICEGLCTVQQLSCIERGEKAASKLLQDAILERLGVGSEDYEHYLNHEVYAHWEMRQRILHHITRQETEQAKELLGEYGKRYMKAADCRMAMGERATVTGGNVSDRLERQFWLSMWAQIRSMERAAEEELYRILEEAVSLTVPKLWEKPLEGRVLSFKEQNLILEAERYRKGSTRAGHYRKLLSYMEKSGADIFGMAKVYPKAVYFLCRYGRGGGEAEEVLLGYCSRAVEILRDGNRMYYLWELLEMREFYLERVLKRGESRGGEALEELISLRRENAEWKNALEYAYTQYHVPKETSTYCYHLRCNSRILPRFTSHWRFWSFLYYENCLVVIFTRHSRFARGEPCKENGT